MATRPHVEQHEHRRPPLRLVLTNHEARPARGRLPVDAPEVVARQVLAHEVELASDIGSADQFGGVRIVIVAAEFGEGHEFVDAGVNEHLGARRQFEVALAQSERVAEGGAQRPKFEAAASVAVWPMPLIDHS